MAKVRKSVECVALDLPRMSGPRFRHEWVYEAGLVLDTQRPGKVDGFYALTIGVSRLWDGDLSEATSILIDLLKSHGVIECSKLAQQITIKRSDHPGVSVLVCSTSGGE